MIGITLHWFEWEMAAGVGVRRQDGSAGRRNLREAPIGDAWADYVIHIIGAVGECAAAKACGVYWDGSVNAPTAHGDIRPGWQVRTADRPGRRLCVRDRDRAADLFIYVECVTAPVPLIRDWLAGKPAEPLGPWVLNVHGWLTASEARQIGTLDAPNGGGPAHFVRPAALHAIDDLVLRMTPYTGALPCR